MVYLRKNGSLLRSRFRSKKKERAPSEEIQRFEQAAAEFHGAEVVGV
jgi:hypothetical protein